MSDRLLDEVTLAVFGDHDAGYGKTYAQLADEAPDVEEGYFAAECDLNWADFRFGKKSR